MKIARCCLVFILVLSGCSLKNGNEIKIYENYTLVEQIKADNVESYIQDLPQDQSLVIYIGDEVLITTPQILSGNNLDDLGKIAAIEIKNEVFPIIEGVNQLALSDFIQFTKEDLWGKWHTIYRSIQLTGKEKDMIYTHDQDIIAGNNENITLKHGQLYADATPVIGIVIDAPTFTMMDVYSMVESSVKENVPVMIIEVDGLGYLSSDKMDIPWDVHPALSTYPSISNVSLASMLTGLSPKYSKIRLRKDRLLEAETIFELVSDAIYIEGDTALVSTKIDIILNIDRNGNGTDDEVLEATLKAIEKGSSLMFVHFHGVDDVSHNYGPRHQKSIEKWEEIKGYIQEILNVYQGRVILVSDHGLYETSDGGTHGLFHVESMYALIGIMQNGK